MKFLKYFLITIFALNFGNSFAMEEAKVNAQNQQENFESLDAEIKSLSQYLDTLKHENNDHKTIREVIQNIVGLFLKKNCKPEILKFIQENKSFFENKILNLDPANLEKKDYKFLEEFFKLLMLNDVNFQIFPNYGYRGFLEFKNGKIDYGYLQCYPSYFEAFINAEKEKNKEQRFSEIQRLLYEFGNLNSSLSKIVNGYEDSKIPQILLDFKDFYLKGKIDEANAILKELKPSELKIILEANHNIAFYLLVDRLKRNNLNPFESTDFALKDELLGWNILMWAASIGRYSNYILSVIKVQQKFDLLLCKDQQGRNAIDIARLFGNYNFIRSLKGYPEIMDYIQQHCQIPLNPINDFKEAYLNGNIQTAKEIVNYIKDEDLEFIDGKDNVLGWTKPMWIAAEGAITLIEKIDKNEPIFNEIDQLGRNAIDIANLFGNQFDIARRLREHVQANPCREVAEVLRNPDSSCIIS